MLLQARHRGWSSPTKTSGVWHQDLCHLLIPLGFCDGGQQLADSVTERRLHKMESAARILISGRRKSRVEPPLCATRLCDWSVKRPPAVCALSCINLASESHETRAPWTAAQPQICSRIHGLYHFTLHLLQPCAEAMMAHRETSHKMNQPTGSDRQRRAPGGAPPGGRDAPRRGGPGRAEHRAQGSGESSAGSADEDEG